MKQKFKKPVLGTAEISAEYIRLYNLFQRCKNCKVRQKNNGRRKITSLRLMYRKTKKHKKTWELHRNEDFFGTTIHAGSRITVEHCEVIEIPLIWRWTKNNGHIPDCLGSPGCRIHADDLKLVVDFLRLRELEEDLSFEPNADDHFPQDITAFPDEQGTWTKIELTSLI